MKRLWGQRWFFGLAALLAAQSAWAQPGIWAEKMFDKLDHDFGVVAKNAEAKYRLKITNRFQPEVHIASVRTSCGCTAAKPSTDTLASLEEAYIELTMDTVKFSNQKDSSVTIVIDRPQRAEVRIPIRAFIRTDLLLSPGGSDFGSILKGAEAERKINVSYTGGRQNWTIKEVVSKNEHVAAQVVQTYRGNGRVTYDLVVSLKPTAPLGELRDQVVLVTDDPSNPNVPVLISAKVDSEYSVTPSFVDFGTLAPGAKKTVFVTVTGRKNAPFAIAKVEAENSSDRFEVQLPADTRALHRIPLTVIAPADSGIVNDEITITVAGHPDPVMLKTRVNVPAAATTTAAGATSGAGAAPATGTTTVQSTP